MPANWDNLSVLIFLNALLKITWESQQTSLPNAVKLSEVSLRQSVKLIGRHTRVAKIPLRANILKKCANSNKITSLIPRKFEKVLKPDFKGDLNDINEITRSHNNIAINSDHSKKLKS